MSESLMEFKLFVTGDDIVDLVRIRNPITSELLMTLGCAVLLGRLYRPVISWQVKTR